MTVKYFHCNMPGAPTLNDEPGALINVLDACLVDGFGLKSVDSLTVTSNVATATISAGVSGYEPDSVILVAGAGISGLNGEKRILSVTGTTITFAAPGVANGPSGGTITLKMAPLDWEKPFSSTNKAVYRSKDTLGTRMFLRVDDTPLHFSSARVRGYESMFDTENGVGAFPTPLQISEGTSLWGKADEAASNGPRGWLIVGDGRTFYYLVNTVNNTSYWAKGGVLSGFGDFASYRPGDAFACMLQHGWDNEMYWNTNRADDCFDATLIASRTNQWLSSGFYAPRSYTGMGAAIGIGRRAKGYTQGERYSGTASTTSSYPNPADNSLHLCNMAVTEPSVQRGHLRGLYYCTQDVRSAFRNLDKLDGSGELGGRKLLAVRSDSRGWGHSDNGVGFIDITGPWE